MYLRIQQAHDEGRHAGPLDVGFRDSGAGKSHEVLFLSRHGVLQDMSTAFANGQLEAANEAKIRLRYVIRIVQAIEENL